MDPIARSGLRPGGRAAGALVVLSLLLGCSSQPTLTRPFGRWVLPIDEWRRAFEPPPPLAEIKEEPASGLASPEELVAESGGFRSVRLSWSPLLAGEVGGYAVERAPEREGPFERVAVLRGRFETVFVDAASAENDDAPAESLGDGVTVFYRVRAFAPSGHLSRSASEVAAATTAGLPEAPADVRAWSLQPRSVPLAWSASQDPHVVGYLVDRSPSSRGPFEPIARIDSRQQTAFVDEGLGDLRVFYYRVSARNAADALGDPSEPVRAVTKPEPLPPYQPRVAAQRLGVNQVAWEPNVETDLAGYRLLRLRQDSDAPELVVSLPPERTSAEDAELAADEPVTYRVVAVDRDGLESAPSLPIEVRSEGYDLEAVAEPGRVTLRWKARADEGYVRARVLRGNGRRSRELAVVEGDSYVDESAAPGARHRYSVILERADGSQAPASTPVRVAVPGS